MTEPTPQQSAFIERMRDSKDNICLEACAGSGKTTTMVMGVNELGPTARTTCCAFNVRIARELETKMPPNATCKTLNSLGMKAWGRRAKFGKVEERKTWIIAKELGFQYSDFPDLKRLVGVAKATGLVPESAKKRGLLDDTQDSWQSLVEDYSIDLSDEEGNPLELAEAVEQARSVLDASIKAAWQGVCDFDDQLYMPAIWDGEWDYSDTVVIDEVQDVSPIQRRMVKRMAGLKGRIIAVGDRYQSIYAFRGADSESIPRFIEEFSCASMPLTVSFRCPRAVVREAQQFVPTIESHESAPEGLVADLDHWNHTLFKHGDAIVCRNTFPLMETAWRLLNSGVGCRVVGRDIGETLIKLGKKLSKSTNDIEFFRKNIESYETSKVLELRAKGKGDLAERVVDQCQALQLIAHRARSVRECLEKIDEMFSWQARCGKCGWSGAIKSDVPKCPGCRDWIKATPPVTLTTVHKAKGLEWYRVFFLDRHLIPSRFAQTESALRQEDNIAYVAVTRAKRELYYINSAGWR